MPPKTEAEINAEKAAKSRPDLVPATAVSALLELAPPDDDESAYSYLLTFRLDLNVRALINAMHVVADALGGVSQAMLFAGQVMGYGYRKHGKCTWRVAGTEQADPQTHLASAERHLLEHRVDPDATEEGSGYPVLWHALAQLCILYDLIVDPPHIEGVNDGHGMIGSRPMPPASGEQAAPPTDDPTDDDPTQVRVGDVRRFNDGREYTVIRDTVSPCFEVRMLFDGSYRTLDAAQMRSHKLLMRGEAR